MKKSYLAPKSETLMAILAEICNDPHTDPIPPFLPGSIGGGFGAQ